MEQNRPSLSDNYTQPTTPNPTLEGLESSSSKLEIKPQGTESTLKGIQGESSDIEVKPQASETTEASHYPARPQFNKTPKYVKYIEMLVQVSVNTTMEHLDMKRDQDSISHQKQTHTT